ncbi:MAG: Sensor protein FixL, partial [Pseudomonadota bacterium]
QTGWMTSITDITEPKRVREELSASYERFATVLDSLDTAISVAPLGSVELLFANKMYRNWLGQRGDGHRQLLDLACIAPRPAEATVAQLAGETAAVGGHGGNGGSAEIWLPELDKWLEVRTRYLTWVDGRMAQMVIASDITARRHAEELGAQQAERAQTASRLITMGEMASSVAHELNQPLTAINNYCSGMISRLKRQQINEEELLGALEKTMKQAQRAGQIIQRIRAFVKRSEPNVTLSDVAQMVGNATELAEIELRRHQIRLNSYLAARLPALMVDPILIEQVLINLIKNGGESIQQAQRPPIQRHVELRVSQRLIEQHPVVEFCVQDTGQGVPPEMLERIYEAFYSTKAEGMGIGLKLCRSIVEAHHGRLQARNLYNPDGIVGCEFSFWIPVTEPTRSDAETTTPAPSAGLIAKE